MTNISPAGNAPTADPTALTLRNPLPVEAAAFKQLIERCVPLEPNTTYAYLLFCTHFAETCLVAEDQQGLLGCIVGYRPPTKPDTLFVWQIGVDQRGRGIGLGSRMLETLVDQCVPHGVRHLEATVAPSNTASDALFRRFAAKRGLLLERTAYFEEQHFGGDDHEAEYLYRIGLTTATTEKEKTEQ